MPPKGKVAVRPKEKDAQASQPLPPPQTIDEQTAQRRAQTQPFCALLASTGPSSLSPHDRTAWTSILYTRSPAASKKLTTRAARDAWRHANETSPSPRSLPSTPSTWGVDRNGRPVGSYTPAQFAERAAQRARLTALEGARRAWAERRDRADRGFKDPLTGEELVLTEEDYEEERARRKEISKLRMELYGKKTGTYAQDPEWDDVVPIPVEEPEGALAAIAYPEGYAEAISYLRAVMLSAEHTPRALRLTEHIISMNASHYTVWLFRFAALTALKADIPAELAWVNAVALERLKNYQIWHHRQLLLDAHLPAIAHDAKAVQEFAKSETAFIARILAEDEKNYHVWSYRQHLVRKLVGITGQAPTAGDGAGLDEGQKKAFLADELSAVETLIEKDVRNNSAWSHRFFLVFSNPSSSTPGSHSTEPDAAVPAAIIDREVAFAQGKIKLAPQNQSPWNYLRGVLVKGGRKLGSVEEFAAEFVGKLGEEEEDVKSTHAVDLLAEIFAEKGEKEMAVKYLTRLAEKWDRIRKGYWEWRMQTVLEGVEGVAAAA